MLVVYNVFIKFKNSYPQNFPVQVYSGHPAVFSLATTQPRIATDLVVVSGDLGVVAALVRGVLFPDLADEAVLPQSRVLDVVLVADVPARVVPLRELHVAYLALVLLCVTSQSGLLRRDKMRVFLWVPLLQRFCKRSPIIL